MSAERQGWFADASDEPDGGHPWQPFLQLDGLCLPLRVWFASEQECLDFIKGEVIGQSVLEQ